MLLNTKVSGMQTRKLEMEGDFRSGQMVLFTKDTGKVIKRMEEEG